MKEDWQSNFFSGRLLVILSVWDRKSEAKPTVLPFSWCTIVFICQLIKADYAYILRSRLFRFSLSAHAHDRFDHYLFLFPTKLLIKYKENTQENAECLFSHANR